VLFALFGIWLLLDTAIGLRWVALSVTGAVAVAATTALVRSRRQHFLTLAQLESSPAPESPPAGYCRPNE